MSAIGRVFLILNLILAATFLGWASTALASRANLSEKLTAEKDAHAKTKTTLEAEISALRTDLNQEKDAKETARRELDVKQESLRNKEAELTQEKGANAELRSNLEKMTSSLDDYNNTNKRLESEKSAALQAAAAAEAEKGQAIREREAALAAQNAAELARSAAENLLASLEKSNTSLKKDNESLNLKLQTLGEMFGVGASDVATVKDIDGRVLQVDMGVKPGLLALNVGTSQGVARGMVFDIYSGTIYKGQARVETVDANYSSALILRQVAGTSISQGDNATTKL
jgi:hypothetical protein